MCKENKNNKIIDGWDKCIRNKGSDGLIVLDGPDIFYIAKMLGINIEEAITEYCEWNLGPASGLPVIYLKETYNGNCTFYNNGQCSVHDSMPIVCTVNRNNNDTHISIDVKTKSLAKTHREDILDEYIRWNAMARNLASRVGQLPKESQEIVAPYCMKAMYTEFDESKDFMESFDECEALAERIIESVGYALEAAGIDPL